jgi:Flp pilus assembly protein TadG
MMAIIFIFLLPMTFLVVQTGLYYHAKQRAAAAADRGAEAAAAAGGDQAAGEQAAGQLLANMPVGSNAGKPTVKVQRSADGRSVEVTVTAEIDPIIDIGTLTVNASSTARIEQFVPEPQR